MTTLFLIAAITTGVVSYLAVGIAWWNMFNHHERRRNSFWVGLVFVTFFVGSFFAGILSLFVVLILRGLLLVIP